MRVPYPPAAAPLRHGGRVVVLVRCSNGRVGVGGGLSAPDALRASARARLRIHNTQHCVHNTQDKGHIRKPLNLDTRDLANREILEIVKGRAWQVGCCLVCNTTNSKLISPEISGTGMSRACRPGRDFGGSTENSA